MKKAFIFLLGFLTGLALLLRLRYGGGEYYPDVTGTPAFPTSALDTVVAHDEPIGNVAVSASGRIFFTLHPESRPESNKLVEWKNGQALTYPNDENLD